MSEASSKTKSIAIRYHHLGVVCSDVNRSRDFYKQFGFQEKGENNNNNNNKDSSSGIIISNEAGLRLHLFQTSRPHPNNENILMDHPDEKFPGHTHMSFGVGSVPGVQNYFDSQSIPLSGTRGFPGKGTVAIFVRDPDRTVLEFERNDGKDDETPVDSVVLSNPPRGGIDHIGTRISNPEVHWEWYVRVLGLNDVIMKYDLDPEPKKNFRPWIIRTQHGRDSGEIDINLILNATTTGENVLLSDGQDPLPGIVYAAYVVDSIDEALQSIDPSDIARTENDLKKWGIPPKFYIPNAGKKSCFVRDFDKNIFRLIEL